MNLDIECPLQSVLVLLHISRSRSDRKQKHKRTQVEKASNPRAHSNVMQRIVHVLRTTIENARKQCE